MQRLANMQWQKSRANCETLQKNAGNNDKRLHVTVLPTNCIVYKLFDVSLNEFSVHMFYIYGEVNKFLEVGFYF